MHERPLLSWHVFCTIFLIAARQAKYNETSKLTSYGVLQSKHFFKVRIHFVFSECTYPLLPSGLFSLENILVESVGVLICSSLP